MKYQYERMNRITVELQEYAAESTVICTTNDESQQEDKEGVIRILGNEENYAIWMKTEPKKVKYNLHNLNKTLNTINIQQSKQDYENGNTILKYLLFYCLNEQYKFYYKMYLYIYRKCWSRPV